MKNLKRIILCGLLCALCLGCLTAVASAATKFPSETNPFVSNYYVEPINQEAPFFDKVLPEIKKNIKTNNKHTISPYYDALPLANNPENLQSLGSTSYAKINGKTVTADAFFRVKNESLSDPNNGMGLLIYQCIEYKRKHPEEDVKIWFSSYRTSVTASVCVIPESKYYGYMRSLYGTNYDEHGFVRISYMLTEAARMGIDVTLVNQLPSYAVSQYDPSTGKTRSRSHLNYKTYYNEAVKSDCYDKYAPGKKVSDFMNCVTVDWKVSDKTVDMQHVKCAAVSHYLASDGTEHTGSVFFSSANLDENNYRGANGNNGAQTGCIVSDHDELYRVVCNYLNLMIEYKDQEGLFELRKLVKQMNEEQYELIKSGREKEIPRDKQILYLGSKTDKVFQLYFTPFGGGADSWEPKYNPICYHANKLADSDDYVEYIWNEWNVGKCNLSNVLQQKVRKAYVENPNVLNKIMIRTDYFDTVDIEALNLGSEIGYRDIKQTLSGLHTKDFMMSYSENGVRHRVSLVTSCNFYMAAFNYRTNSMLVIDETDKSGGNYYNILGEKYSYGMINNDLMVTPANLSLDTGASYKLDVDYAGSKKLTWTSSKTSVATVSNGKIKAIKPGSATITVTDGTYKDTVKLKVMDCVKCNDKDGGQKFNTDEQFVLSKKYPSMPLTFEAEFSVAKSSLTGTTTLLGSDDGHDPALIYSLNKSGQPRVQVRDKTGSKNNKTYVFNEVNVATGKKVHLSIVTDLSKKKMYCYVDGKLKQTLSGIGTITPFIDKYAPVIGGDHRNGNATFFTGEIHSIAVWADQRTAKEIASDYKNGVSIHDVNMMAYYDLTLCEDCMLEDLSKNGNNLVHVPLWTAKKDIEPLPDYEYSFAVVGDTQTMCEKDPEAMDALYEWIVANKNKLKIQYVLGLGDITENRGNVKENSAKEWDVASKAIARLNGEIPYSLSRGNHDNFEHFNSYLHNGFYENSIDGQMTKGDLTNSYRYLSIQGKDYLIMTLDFAPSSKVLDWANSVIKKHPNHKVIVTTHAYMYRDGTTMDDNDLYPPTHYGGYTDAQNGDDMWAKCFSKHKNVLMVLSGHDPWQQIVYRQDKGVKGNYVTQMLVDSQYVDLYNGSVGMVAMMYFSNDGNTITMRYYSVEKDCYGSPLSQFTINLNEHEHQYTTAYTAATLTENGKAVTTCKTCDEVKQTKTIYSPKTFTLSETSYTYNGKTKTPTVAVKDTKGNTLVENKDYVVSYESGRQLPGKYTVKLIFKGQYSGVKRVYFNIKPTAPTGISAKCKTVDLTLSWKEVKGADGYRIYQYDKATKKYKHIASVTKGTQYKVTKLTGKTEYKFKVRAYKKDSGTIWGNYSNVFTTKTKTPTKAKTFKLGKTLYTYDGKVKAPAVTVKDAKGNVLKKGTDYTVTYEKGRKMPGKYTVNIVCKGNYSGEKKLYFKIKAAAPKSITSKKTTSRITLSWKKAAGADGYRVFQYNAKTKTYKRIADIKSTSYKVKNLKAGTIYKFKVRAYTKDDGEILGNLSAVYTTATKTKTPSIKSISSTKKGKVSLSWSNVSGETGYQVYYSTKRLSGYKKAASYKMNVVKGTVSELKSGKAYYFKVRTYKKTASGYVYSSWSSAKRIKVK